MPVEHYIDINVKEQCEEIRGYIHALGAPIPAQQTDNYLTDLQQIIANCDILFKVEKEQEIEMVLNSIVSVLFFDTQVAVTSALVDSFCEQMAKVPSPRLAAIAFRVLQNLSNGLSNNVQLRYRVYTTLVRLCAQAGQIRTVYSAIPQMKKWFNNENVGAEKLQMLLRLLHDILQESRQFDLASKVMVELLMTYTEENASQAREDAHKCIVSAIADPNTFLMDHLLALKPVKFLEGEQIHELLTIFVTENLSSYLKFYNANTNFITENLGISHEANMHKMRLLTFMQLAESKKEITFAEIEKELQLKPEKVESFVVDTMKTKLVKAHIDQVNRKVIVSCTMHRTFGRPQWQQLRDTLTKCAGNMKQVQQTLQKHIDFESQTHG